MATSDRDLAREGHHRAAGQFAALLASGAGVVSRTFLIAGRRVDVRIVGTVLADTLTAPWRHLQVPSTTGQTASGLRIDVWHERETGLAPSPAADDIDPFSRFPYQVSRDDRFLAVRQPSTVVWLDRVERTLVGCVRDVSQRTLYEAGRPLETPLLVWLRDAGVALAHASLVARADRGVVIVGPSGSGKSTLAAECLCAGFSYLGDDKIAFIREQTGFTGYSLSNSLHLGRESLARLPLLAAYAVAPVSVIDDKYRVPLDPRFAESLVASVKIAAILIPRLRVAEGEHLHRASRRDALLAMALSTLTSLPIAASRSLGQLAELVEAVPAWCIDLGPDGDPPALVAELLRM